MFMIISEDENENARLMAVNCVTVHQHNIHRLILRLRDKNEQIRLNIVQKLQLEDYPLTNLKTR